VRELHLTRSKSKRDILKCPAAIFWQSVISHLHDIFTKGGEKGFKVRTISKEEVKYYQKVTSQRALFLPKVTQGKSKTCTKRVKVHGNFHVPKYMIRYMEISMYLAICLAVRYMEIPMCVEVKHMARYIEISMFLAAKHIARYMEISRYLAAKHVKGTWKCPLMYPPALHM